jgi:hypothetical protein
MSLRRRRRSSRLREKKQKREQPFLEELLDTTHRIRNRVDHPSGYYDACVMRGRNDFCFGVQTYLHPDGAPNGRGQFELKRNPKYFFHIARDVRLRGWYCAHPENESGGALDPFDSKDFDYYTFRWNDTAMLAAQHETYHTVIRQALWLK